MGSLVQGISYLLAKISAALTWIGELFVSIFVAAWDIILDSFTWVFEQLMTIVVSAMGSIDVSGMTSAGQWWGGLPAEVLNMLGLLGFDIAMSLIITALGIRLLLQLIPFTRLGS
jgi:hypothetical protein